MSALAAVLTVEQLWLPAPGGSGTYIEHLIRALARRSDVEVTGLSAWHGSTARVPVPVRRWPLPHRATDLVWPRLRGAGAFSAPRDAVLHATTWAVPPHRGPLVVTVHDLAFLRDPGHFTPHGNRFFRRAMSVVRDEADAVVVPSRATAEDCLRAGFEAGRLHVVPHGVAVPTPAPDEVARWRAGHGLTRPYLLWTGTLEPRKNLPTLLAAFGAVAAERSDLDLVLVGPAGWGGADAAVRAALAELPQGRVHALGRLPTAALHLAYAGAHALGFPSTWEGFGLPVLEAMAHGVPVVTSAGTSMAEVCGDAGILVDPRSADELAAGLLAAAGPRHDELATAARARASEFTWESSAERHVAAYRAAAGT